MRRNELFVINFLKSRNKINCKINMDNIIKEEEKRLIFIEKYVNGFQKASQSN